MDTEKRRIPIVYPMPEHYRCLAVSLLSLVSSAKQGTFYDISIICDEEAASLEARDEVKRSLESYNNWNITFLPVNEKIKSLVSKASFIKRSAFYRLIIPEEISDNKCIYLDADTIVCNDLGELYDTDVNDSYLAGVPAFGIKALENKEEYCKQADLPDLDFYINTGVMVMNLDLLRKDNCTDKFLECMKRGMISQDQDAVNSVCYGKIKLIPFRYNVMTKYADWDLNDYPASGVKSSIISGWANPCIIHYADRIKPWHTLDCALGDYWWEACRRSVVWPYYFLKMSDDFFYKGIYCSGKNKISTKHLPGLFSFRGRKISIYGAGARGRRFCEFLLDNGVEVEEIIVTDTSVNFPFMNNIVVKQIDEIPDDNWDKTLFIATSEKHHAEILANLKDKHFKEIIPLSDVWSDDEYDGIVEFE